MVLSALVVLDQLFDDTSGGCYYSCCFRRACGTEFVQGGLGQMLEHCVKHSLLVKLREVPEELQEIFGLTIYTKKETVDQLLGEML